MEKKVKMNIIKDKQQQKKFKYEPFYFCKKCGNYHDPFAHNNRDLERLSKNNLCDKCDGKQQEMFGHEKAIPKNGN